MKQVWMAVSLAGRDSPSCSVCRRAQLTRPKAQDLSFIYNSATRVHLIDIPGFTDADKEGDNTGAQETALARINALISTGKPTSGIISLHPITNKYNTGLVLRNIELSRELCGPNAEAHSLAVLATSI